MDHVFHKHRMSKVWRVEISSFDPGGLFAIFYTLNRPMSSSHSASSWML